MFDLDGLSDMSDMDIYLRTPLLRVVLRLTVSNEDCRICWRIFPVVPARYGLICNIRHTWGSMILFLGLIYTRSLVGGLFGIFIPCST